MKRLFKTILITILLAVLMPATAADMLFKTLDARHGLTSSQINCILKDSRGFMWFGTPAGLYRFDGYIVKHFQCDSQDGSSLPDSYIEDIQETLDRNLWVKTPAGYCIYKPQTETFERDMRQEFARLGIKTIPDIIYIDKHKNLWGYIPNRGVICYNMEQQLVFEFGYTDDVHGIPQGNVCSIGECSEGAIIVYEDGLIVCCDVMHQQQTLWSNNEIALRQLRKTKSLRVFTDQMNNIWLYGQGTLFVYNRNSHTWNTTIGDQLGLTGISVDHAVNSMAGDRNGNIWVATNRNGLVCINVNTYDMEHIEMKGTSTMRRLSLNVSVNSVFVDDSNLLWVGTAKAGIAYYGSSIYKFEADPCGDVTAIAQDSTGQIWYGTSDNGIVGYDGPLASLKVTAMAYTPDGSLWIGSKQNGLTRIKGGNTEILSASSNNRKTLLDDHINALCTDQSGNLWIATDGGLQVYNPRMDQFSNYTRENGKLKTNNITSLYFASGNRMLIGTSDGLNIMNILNTNITQLTGNTTNIVKFTNNYVTQVFEDSRRLIWVCTREGANILNLENDNLDFLTEKQGLCNNNICGIAEDKNHNIWLSTSNGVSRVVIQRSHEEGTYNYGLYNYNHNDGLLSDEFNLGAIMTKNDGNVIIGGLFGTNWVRPNTADEREAIPLVMLTQLFIGEEEILTGQMYEGTVPLPNALNESSRIELKNFQNTFTIKFAAGNYNQSERLQFMYWMEGLDNSWKNGDAMKHGVTFTDLSSGKYKLHVKAISAEGSVSVQERIIEIVIERPWYLQWWMLVFYVIIIIGALYVWKKGIDQARDIWRKKKAILTELTAQREEIKATSDELRQPMSRMTSIIMNLAEKDATLEEREQLNALHSQMLQVITRVSDMQLSLEHPEVRARANANKNLMLNSRGEMELPEMVNDELTYEIHSRQGDSPTHNYKVMFIDNNIDFLKLISSRMRNIYEFHPYNDIRKAVNDIKSMIPDVVICKQDMPTMTGSELCNNIKMHAQLNKIKFILMTDTKLSPREMVNQGIALSADDYLYKPFNLQEAAMRINKLLGIESVEMNSELIEGAETRMLEEHNSSMTTSTETQVGAYFKTNKKVSEDDEIRSVAIKSVRSQEVTTPEQSSYFDNTTDDSDLSMTDAMDRQLISSIEQYVQQNMSRGQINLEEMASAMGMAMKPFFQKVRDVTGKTPAEVVRDLRLKNACVLLQRTNINMSELATNIGFATGEHFINVFKERFGISPSEYRQRYRH